MVLNYILVGCPWLWWNMNALILRHFVFWYWPSSVITWTRPSIWMKSEAVITGNSEKMIFMKKKLKIKLKKNKRKKKQVAKREILSCRGFQFRHSAREAQGLPLYRPSKKSDCGCVRFGNPDFGFCNRTRNPITDFISERSVLKVDFN